jgi:hypothetical protein
MTPLFSQHEDERRWIREEFSRMSALEVWDNEGGAKARPSNGFISLDGRLKPVINKKGKSNGARISKHKPKF